MDLSLFINQGKIKLQKQQHPTSQLIRYLRFIYQVLQSKVVGTKDKLIAQKIMAELVYHVDHGEGFFFGCSIVLLGFGEKSRGICNRVVDLASL